MAVNYDEMRAVADVYAEALLRAADERGETEEVAAQFADLIAYMDANPDFDTFLTAASVDDDPRRASLQKLFRGKMHDLVLNLLLVMNDRFRSQLVRSVQRCVQLRMEARHHQQEVLVETAVPLTDGLRGILKEDLSRRIGREALLIEEVDPALIGGIVIHIEDEQIDGSVAMRIRTLHQKLIERAREEIHGGRGYEA